MNSLQYFLYREMHTRNLILKARQLGFSTFVQIFILDQCLFHRGVNAGVIAHKLTAATEIFDDKIKFAYDNLPEAIKQRVRADTSNTRELKLSNDSKIVVDVSLRSGTYNLLHISEYGKICAQHPERAREIKTGALNTVDASPENAVFIESTAEGKSGHFWELCRANWNRTDELSTLDYKFLFFPWWEAPEYELETKVFISQEMSEYFIKIKEEQDIRLSNRQKYWYVKKAEEQGDDIKREMPSYKEEAFEQAVLGAWFHKQMAFLEKSDQIGGYPHDPGHVVDTFWDIGHSDFTSIWFYQNIHGRNVFIDYFQYNGELAPFYAKKLQEKQKKHGYVYGKHYFPHDTGNTTFIGNPRDTLQKLGVTATVGQRVTEKIDAIDAARIKLPTCFFDKKKTVKGLNALKNYRKKWNTSMGEFSDTQSVHDWASHGSDAFMEFATNYTGPVSQTPLKYKNDRIYA